MAKMSIEEFNQKLSDKLKDNEDLAIELMEDVSDSFRIDEDAAKKIEEEKNAEIERLSGELTDLKARYKERFLTPASKEVIEDIKEEPVEVQEEEVIDIKEI